MFVETISAATPTLLTPVDLWEQAPVTPKPFVLDTSRIEYYQYLFGLQRSGICNMFESPIRLKSQYNMSESEANDIAFEWMDNYDHLLRAFKEQKLTIGQHSTSLSEDLVDVSLESPSHAVYDGDASLETPSNSPRISSPSTRSNPTPCNTPIPSAPPADAFEQQQPIVIDLQDFCQVIIPDDNILSPFEVPKNLEHTVGSESGLEHNMIDL